jgi:hypothetical protein
MIPFSTSSCNLEILLVVNDRDSAERDIEYFVNAIRQG